MISVVLFSFIVSLFRLTLAETNTVTNETAHCMAMRNLLFHPVDSADQQKIEFARYLPIFMKKFMSEHPIVNHDVDLPGHSRFDVLGPVGPACKTPLESYGTGDDEKRACGLQQLQHLNLATVEGKGGHSAHKDQHEQRQHEHDCVVYSIGSNNQWGFEEDIVKKTQCRVETFDCTVAASVQPPLAIRDRVRLHHICLSDSDYEREGRKYMSWISINKLTGMLTSPTFLKMDIESYEYPVLRSIIDSGEYLPLQMALEYHAFHLENPGGHVRKVNSLELYAFIQYIYKFGGYYLIDRHDNPLCDICSEIVLAKLQCDNFPKPSNEEEILLGKKSGIPQHSLYEKDMKKTFAKRYVD